MEEVAQIVEGPEATVKTRMFYARQHLAELMIAAVRTHNVGQRDVGGSGNLNPARLVNEAKALLKGCLRTLEA